MMQQLGIAYMSGQWVEKDSDAAYFWLKKAFESYDSRGMKASVAHHIGKWAILTEELRLDAPTAFRWLLKAYDLDPDDIHDNSRYELGLCYMDGIGTNRSVSKARDMFLEDAMSDAHVGSQPKSMCKLAEIYASGELGEKAEEVYKWFRRAYELCKSRDYDSDEDEDRDTIAASRAGLAYCYTNGIGCARNDAEASALWKLVHDNKHALALKCRLETMH